MLDEILTARPPDPQAEATYGEGPVELTSISSPPTAEVSLADSRPRVGKFCKGSLFLARLLAYAGPLSHPAMIGDARCSAASGVRRFCRFRRDCR